MNKLDQTIFEIAHEQIAGKDVERAAARVRRNLAGQGGFGSGEAQTATGPQRLRGCSDYQALMPVYLDKTLSAGRALLLQDHTRECVVCRQALHTARAGVKPTLIRPVTAPTDTISKYWAIAAGALLGAGLTAWGVSQTMGGSTGHIAVQTVNGILYAVSDSGSTPIFAGKEIAAGQRVRTAKASTAVVKLGDGSLVEMGERAELSVVAASHGTNVRLDRGNIIIQAAKQHNGTLDVLTPDCTVSVKGTIFAVGRGTKGTRVSVVEGSVKVDQGAQSQLLKPGDQVTTDASLVRTSVKDDVAWSRDSGRYLQLLTEFNALKQGIEAIPSPNLRYHSKLAAYVPDNTVMYAAIPNIGPSLGAVERMFNERLQQSEVLRTWWNEQQGGPKLQEMVDHVRLFSQYLGNEIVVAVGGNGRGDYGAPVILAEVKLPGLEGFLRAEMNKLSQQGAKGLPEVVQLDGTAGGQHESYYRHGAAGTPGTVRIGLKDGLMVVGFNQDQMNEVARRVADKRNISDSELMQTVESGYTNGAGWLFCVNMEQIVRNSVGNGKGRHAGPMNTGIETVRNLMVERKEVSGQVNNQATLTFRGRREGIAGWLAAPSALGSLDFVSPNATFAVSMALENPERMLRDLFEVMKQESPGFEAELQRAESQSRFQVIRGLAQPLGGEFTFAVDGPLLPLPSWKLAIEVYNPERLQAAIGQLIDGVNIDGVNIDGVNKDGVNKDTQCADCKVTLAKDTGSAQTFYTLTTGKLSYEIDYTYVDGYLLAAPSRTLLNRAIQNRQTGIVLARSEAFRAQLPRDGRMNFSALIYHNVGSAIAPIAGQLGSTANLTGEQQAALKSMTENAKPGLIYAYGEADRITVATAGTFFGLDLNAMALPNLIRMGTGGPGGMARKGMVERHAAN